MSCLTDDQIAQVALGKAEDGRFVTHIEKCDACRAKLMWMQTVARQLTAVHAELNESHAASRARLLDALSRTDVPQRKPFALWKRLTSRFRRLTLGQRVATGGITVTTAVMILLMVLTLANSARPLSAMERMLRAVREVKSYSYKLLTQDTFVRNGDTEPSTVTHTNTTYWLEPKSLYYDEKLMKFEGTVPQGEGKLLSHVTGIHPTGRPGMLVYHAGTGRATKSMEKTYFWVPDLPSMSAEDIGNESPITKLRMVREGTGRVLRELGTKQIEGKQARGYVMALEGAKPNSGFDALEVWVDPETDLPLEFGFELKRDGGTDVYRVTECKWNIDIDPTLFDTTPPKGYEDITPPSSDAAIAEVVAALQLYADLSGGHYPRVTTFNADAIRNEMLSLAKYTGQRQEDWQKLQQIEQATVGLKRIAPVLRNTINAGYYGTAVSPQDKDKVLLWWNVVDPRDPQESSYRVFYGDLRTEILPFERWSRLVPEEASAPHQPQ